MNTQVLRQPSLFLFLLSLCFNLKSLHPLPLQANHLAHRQTQAQSRTMSNNEGEKRECLGGPVSRHPAPCPSHDLPVNQCPTLHPAASTTQVDD
jgi:hypothetical protein